MRFEVVFRRDREDGGWIAHCPALPGCASQGETKREAARNIRGAIEGVLLVRSERARG